MKTIFDPHGFIALNPALPGFARPVFQSRESRKLFILEPIDDETGKYEPFDDDSSVVKFHLELRKSLARVLDKNESISPIPIYVFVWGDGRISAGNQEHVASEISNGLRKLIAFPYIYVSAASFVHAVPSMRAERLPHLRDKDIELWYSSDERVALFDLNADDRVSRLRREKSTRRDVSEVEIKAKIDVRDGEGVSRQILRLARSYLEMQRNEDALRVLDAVDTISQLPSGSQALDAVAQIDDMLTLADRELDKGNLRYSKLTYSRALDVVKHWSASKAWTSLAAFSVEKRLQNIGSRTQDSFEWKALDALFKELCAGLGRYPKTSGHSARTLVDLGNFYTSLKRFGEAKQTLELASNEIPHLQLMDETEEAKTSYRIFLSWGEFEEQTQAYESAEANFESALSHARRLGEHKEALEILAAVLARVSSFYLARERFVASEATAKEALSLWGLLAKAGDRESKRGLQTALDLLERLYATVGRQEELSLIRKNLDVQQGPVS